MMLSRRVSFTGRYRIIYTQTSAPGVYSNTPPRWKRSLITPPLPSYPPVPKLLGHGVCAQFLEHTDPVHRVVAPACHSDGSATPSHEDTPQSEGTYCFMKQRPIAPREYLLHVFTKRQGILSDATTVDSGNSFENLTRPCVRPSTAWFVMVTLFGVPQLRGVTQLPLDPMGLCSKYIYSLDTYL